MKLGTAFVNELNSRDVDSTLFDYEEYQHLKTLQNLPELKAFLSQKFNNIENGNTILELADLVTYPPNRKSASAQQKIALIILPIFLFTFLIIFILLDKSPFEIIVNFSFHGIGAYVIYKLNVKHRMKNMKTNVVTQP